MNTKIIGAIIISLLILDTLSLGTATETDLKNTITITKNQTDTTGTVPIEVTKEEETIKETETTETQTLEKPTIVEPKIIEIRRKIRDISRTTIKKRILIDSQTTNLRISALEIKPKPTIDLSAREIRIKEFILEKNTVPENRKKLRLLRNKMALGRYIEVDLPTTDIEWTIIKISYNDREITENNLSEESLRLIWYDEDPASATYETWVELRNGEPEWVHGVGVDLVENYAWTNVSHTSVYGLTGTIIGPLPTTEPPTPTPEPTTTAPPTTTPAPITAAPTTTPSSPTISPPTTTPAPFTETVEPEVLSSPPTTPRESGETRQKKGVCGPTSILALTIIPLLLLGAKSEER